MKKSSILLIGLVSFFGLITIASPAFSARCDRNLASIVKHDPSFNEGDNAVRLRLEDSRKQERASLTPDELAFLSKVAYHSFRDTGGFGTFNSILDHLNARELYKEALNQAAADPSRADSYTRIVASMQTVDNQERRIVRRNLVARLFWPTIAIASTSVLVVSAVTGTNWEHRAWENYLKPAGRWIDEQVPEEKWFDKAKDKTNEKIDELQGQPATQPAQ